MNILRFLLTVLVVMCLAASLSAQTVQWVRTGVSGSPTGAFEIAADNGGSVYAYGTFTGIITFGTHTLNSGTTLNHYLVKYASDGTPVWAKKISGTPTNVTVQSGYQEGTAAYNLAITNDQKGGIYIAGQFQGSVTIGTRTLTTSSQSMLFLAKLDTNGNDLWAIKCGAYSATVTGLAADSLGNLFLSGYWSYPAPLQFGTYSLTFLGVDDAFLAKIRQDSTVLWLKGVEQTSRYEKATSVAADRFGNAYVTGTIADPASEGAGLPGAYVAKFDPNGTFKWEQYISSLPGGFCEGLAVTVNQEGYVYFAGRVDRGGSPFKFDTLTLSSRSEYARFIAKFTPAGNIVVPWVENPWAENSSVDALPNGSLTSDIAGNIYYGGAFRDSMTLGPFRLRSFATHTVTAFVAGLTPSLQFKWTKQNNVLSNRRSQIYSMSSTPYADVYACGTFSDTAKFDTVLGTGTGVNSFIVKISMPWIFTGKIHGSPFCAGFPIDVPFTLKGNFPENTVFYLQLSDSTGSFSSALTIDSLQGTSLLMFNSQLPIDLPSGTMYRMRVISKSPAVIGSDNGVNLRIIAAPVIRFKPVSPIRVCDLTIPAQVTASADSVITTFTWRDGVTGASRSLPKAGWYYVTVENAFTCARLDSIEVIDLPPVEALITPSRELPMCEGSNVDLVASGGLRYAWSRGDTTKTINVEAPGLYTVTVYDIAGCSDTTSIMVMTRPGPTIALSLEEVFFLCPGDSVTVTATEAPNYLWSTGDTTRSIVITREGLYHVSTADSNCRGYSKTLFIEFHKTTKPQITRNGDTLSTNVMPPVRWFFNGVEITGETGQTLIVVATGVYTVQKIDSNSCLSVSNGFPVTVAGVDNTLLTGIRIQPNPVRDRLRVSLPVAGDYSFELYDVLGKHVVNLFEGYCQTSIDVRLPASLASGSYVLRIKVGETAIRSFTLIKE